MSAATEEWLVIAGPLSGYTFEVFREVQRRVGVRIRILHDPIDSVGAFAHESFEASGFVTARWRNRSPWSVRRFMVEVMPRAVFIHGTMPRLPILIASRELSPDVPVLYAADDNISAITRDPTRAMLRAASFRLLMRRVDAALSLGFTNRLALEFLGVKRVLDAPFYPVDYAAWDNSAPASSGRTDTRLVVLIVARLIPKKNVVPFVRALALDAELARAMRIVVVGDGPDRSELEHLAERYRSEGGLRVDLLGAIVREKLGPVFREADVLVLPSLEEPWGIVVTEALGMGVPVVCSPAVGAGASLAGATQAVVIAADASPGALCAALRSYVARAELLRASARAAAAWVRARYDTRAVAARLVAAVEQVRRERAAAPSGDQSLENS